MNHVPSSHRDQCDPEADGSQLIELSDGTIATIPAAQIPQIALLLQNSLVQRVFEQSQRMDVPTESSFALLELHVIEAKPATRDRLTSLSCNLTECGWAVLLCEDDVLRQMKTQIDRVLAERLFHLALTNERAGLVQRTP
jgi:hypothetical protein